MRNRTASRFVYVICSTFVDPEDGVMWWNNENGWMPSRGEATEFTAEQRAVLGLPMEGQWYETTHSFQRLI